MSFARCMLPLPMYLFIRPLSLPCYSVSLGLNNAGWEPNCLGLDWPLSEVGTGLEQQIYSGPHRLIFSKCLPVPKTEHIIIIIDMFYIICLFVEGVVFFFYFGLDSIYINLFRSL